MVHCNEMEKEKRGYCLNCEIEAHTSFRTEQFFSGCFFSNDETVKHLRSFIFSSIEKQTSNQ